ncbi:MAG: flagellinolysin [Schwartzia sp. (in: firmicutes)]
MALTVKNQMAAVHALNTLHKNARAVAADLKKVSSGLRLTSAADDASGYAISERMRVQLRGLSQDIRNTENARSLMRVAEGAVQSTVDILRVMKEKAIDSANDTNTDVDRAIMQKAFAQYIDQIDDNANVTYNGMTLFDGAKDRGTSTEQMILKALNSEYIKGALDLIRDSYGLSFQSGMPSVTDMEVFLEPQGNPSGYLAYVSYEMEGGKATKLELHVNMAAYGKLDPNNSHGMSIEKPWEGYMDRLIAHEMTHAVMAAVIDGFDDLPLFVAEGTAELIHGIEDERWYMFEDENEMTADVLEQLFADGGQQGGGPTGGEVPYAGGFIFFRYMAERGGKDAMKRFMDVLDRRGAAALDDAVAAGTGGQFKSKDELCAAIVRDRRKSPDVKTFLRQHCGMVLHTRDTGSISGREAVGVEVKTRDTVAGTTMSPRFAEYPDANETIIDGLRVHWPAFSRPDAGFRFQTGTRANQVVKAAFADMHATGMGLMDATGKKLSIETDSSARYAMTVLDKSIGKALGQQTYIGAISSRLEYMAQNLTTASEEVGGAESVIRDADMAREVMAYTRDHLLAQAAQSMLAQTNQGSAGVLALLR